MKASIFALLLIAASSFALSACTNTVHGAGRDIENAGEAVQRDVPAKR
jgi:predicted small secreted protein